MNPVIPLWTVAQLGAGEVPVGHRSALRAILRWSHVYLSAPHPELGRSGPVCPYTATALRRDLLCFAVVPATVTGSAFTDLLAGIRRDYLDRAAALAEADRDLLAYIILVPGADPEDATELDRLQESLKDGYVADGLMIGQFHPRCDRRGLWNDAFRPLRSPVPLLAIRRMRDVDLPFLTSAAHVEAYLERFTGLSSRVRGQLVRRLTPGERPT